jgi:hypothetical protein
MLQIPNTVESLACFAWCRYYFDLVGDKEPNTDGEIHLEPCTVQEIFLEYVTEQQLHGLKFLGATQFSEMWMKCFP